MINGIINIYKEKGYTSHDVVAKLRRILNQKKIGHTGTLDPNACGVLPVCLGKATKLCDLLTDKDKIYDAVLLLGTETDTQDTTGTIIKQVELNNIKDKITPKQLEEVIYSFVGEYYQVPPMYSAIKVNGKRLYELAREGKVIERKSRKVIIKNIEIKSINLPRVELTIHCSKGTYVRTLCHDIGNKIGYGACMEELLRTKVERFTLENALTLSEVEKLIQNNQMIDYITPIDKIFEQYPQAVIKEDYNKLLYNGNELKKEYFDFISNEDMNQYIRVYDDKNIFIALYKFNNIENIFKNVKMFNEN